MCSRTQCIKIVLNTVGPNVRYLPLDHNDDETYVI